MEKAVGLSGSGAVTGIYTAVRPVAIYATSILLAEIYYIIKKKTDGHVSGK